MKITIRSLLLFTVVSLSWNLSVAEINAVTETEIASHDAGLSSEHLPDWYDPGDRLPYAMMSYFAEVTKIKGRSSKSRQIALDERVAYLEEEGFKAIEKKDIPEKWLIYYQDGDLQRISIEKSGLRARIYVNDLKKRVVLALAGTDFGDKDSVLSAFSLAYGYSSDALFDGISLAQDLVLKFLPRGYQLELTGASQGGAIAMLAAYETKGRAYVFNSQMPHSDLFDVISEGKTALIKHAYVEGDMLNDSWHYTHFLIQNSIKMESLEMPVRTLWENEIDDNYYRQHGVSYYFTTEAWVRHWTGTVLEVSERLAEREFSPLH